MKLYAGYPDPGRIVSISPPKLEHPRRDNAPYLAFDYYMLD